MLGESTEVIAFEYEATERRLSYCAPQAARLLDCEPDDLIAAGFIESTAHPIDTARGVGTTFHIQIPIAPRSDLALTVAA